MRPAVVILSEPVADHVWREVIAFAELDECQREGAIYHWIADPDTRLAHIVLELADGTLIQGNPREFWELEAVRWRFDGSAEEVLAPAIRDAIYAAWCAR